YISSIASDNLDLLLYLFDTDISKYISDTDIYNKRSDLYEPYTERDKNVLIKNKSILSIAAEYGSINCLIYFYENRDNLSVMKDFEWDKYICIDAVKSASLNCVKYLHENGCPWDEETCSVAAGVGSLECLRYLHENGCPWDRVT